MTEQEARKVALLVGEPDICPKEEQRTNRYTRRMRVPQAVGGKAYDSARSALGKPGC